MSALNENSICKVATVTGVDMKTAAKTTLYTVPSGKTFYPVAVVIREPSASMTGGTDYDLGTGANADTWRQTINLSTLTATTDYIVIPSIAATPMKYTMEAAAAAFGIKPITGATADVTGTMEVWGHEVDA